MLPGVHSRSGILLGVFVLALFAILQSSTAWWLDRNELPDGFQNEYEHTYTLTEVFFRLRDTGWSDAQPALWGGYYPPLEHAVASVAMAVGGRDRQTAVLGLGVFVLLLLGSGALLGRGLLDAPTGAMTAALLACWPSIFGNARRYEPNVALAAMVGAAVVLLILRGGLRDRRTALGFGALCGLGMLADRLVFAVYLAPAALLCLRSAWRGSDRGDALRRWGLAAGVALLLCGWFYAHFFRNHVWEVWTQVGGEVTGTGIESQALPPWTLRGLLYYPLSFVDGQMGLVPGLLTLAGIGAYLRRARVALDPHRRALLEATAFGGLLVITLISKKQPFYAIPLLLPLAAIAALGWRSLEAPRLRVATAALLLLFGAHQLTFLTRGEGLVPTPGRWVWFAGGSPLPPGFLGHEYTQAWAPREQRIDVDRMARICGELTDADRPRTVVFSDAHAVYEGQLMPTLRLLLDTLLVDGVTMLPEAVADRHEDAACFLYVTDGDADWPSGASIQAHWDGRSLGTVPPATLEALRSMQERRRRIDGWAGEPEGRVHAYALNPL